MQHNFFVYGTPISFPTKKIVILMTFFYALILLFYLYLATPNIKEILHPYFLNIHYYPNPVFSFLN